MTWAQHKDALSDDIDATFGEPLEFRPMSKLTVNDASNSDPMRVILELTGVVSRPTQAQNIDTRSFTSSTSAGPTLVRPRVSIDTRQFLPGEDPKRGDQIKL